MLRDEALPKDEAPRLTALEATTQQERLLLAPGERQLLMRPVMSASGIKHAQHLIQHGGDHVEERSGRLWAKVQPGRVHGDLVSRLLA
jgi:hypothetical protein